MLFRSVTKLIAQASTRVDLLDVNGSISKIFQGFKDNKEDVNERLVYLEKLAKLFIDNMTMKHEDKANELSDIFSRDLKVLVEIAIKRSIGEKSFDPLRELLNSEQENVKTIKTAGRILIDEYKGMHLNEAVSPQVQALLDYINDDEIQNLKDRSEEAAKDIEDMAVEANNEANIINEKAEDEVNEMLRKDKEEISDEVSPLLDDLSESFDYNDEEMNNTVNENSQEVIDYIEK